MFSRIPICDDVNEDGSGDAAAPLPFPPGDARHRQAHAASHQVRHNDETCRQLWGAIGETNKGNIIIIEYHVKEQP